MINAHSSLRCVWLHVQVEVYMQVSSHVQFIACIKSYYFHILFCYICPIRRNFSLRNFSLSIRCRKIKTFLKLNFFPKLYEIIQKKCCSLLSSNKPLLIITWCRNTFMFALSFVILRTPISYRFLVKEQVWQVENLLVS